MWQRPVGESGPRSGPSDLFRARAAPIWDALHGHPFITELAAGSLPPEKFRFFLEQDDMYLEEYARCLAMGAARSRSERELRSFLAELNQVMDTELPGNRDLLGELIELGAEDRGGALMMAPANVAYTSYLQSLSLRGGPLEIMACLLPCAWSYVEIATALQRPGTPDGSVGGRWIGSFSDPRNIELVATMRSDFDALMDEEAPSARRREEIGLIFATSSRLERGFWDMAYDLEQWPDLRG
jgi:thiaminase (transcriptional activator TenA)